MNNKLLLTLLLSGCGLVNASTYHLIPSSEEDFIKIEERDESTSYGFSNEKIVNYFVRERIFTAREALYFGARVGSPEIVDAALIKLDQHAIDIVSALTNVMTGLSQLDDRQSNHMVLGMLTAAGVIATLSASDTKTRLIVGGVFASFGALIAWAMAQQRNKAQENYLTIVQRLLLTPACTQTNMQSIITTLLALRTYFDHGHQEVLDRLIAQISDR